MKISFKPSSCSSSCILFTIFFCVYDSRFLLVQRERERERERESSKIGCEAWNINIYNFLCLEYCKRALKWVLMGIAEVRKKSSSFSITRELVITLTMFKLHSRRKFVYTFSSKDWRYTSENLWQMFIVELGNNFKQGNNNHRINILL